VKRQQATIQSKMKEKEIYNDNRTRPDMFIRRATEDDLDTLIRISRKVFPHYLKWCGPKRQAKRWWLATFESQSNEIWVCQSGSKVIGMVIMVTDIELYQKERHRLRPRLGTVLCAFTVRPWLFVANIMGKIASARAVSRTYADANNTMNLAKKPVWLSSGAVLPKMRNNGVGSTMLKFCEQRARELGYDSAMGLVKTSNNGCTRLLEKLGFVKTFEKNNHYRLVKIFSGEP